MRNIELKDWWPELVELKDEMSLRELADRFGATPGAIARGLRRAGITRQPRPDRAAAYTPKQGSVADLVAIADSPDEPSNQPDPEERLWHVDPAELEIPEDRLRAPRGVRGLAESMAQIGQLQPVVVAGDARTVIAGVRRVLAARELGWSRIACVATDADQVLVEIDENLRRQELTAMERAKHLERRRRAYEAAFPETRRGVAGGKARHGAAPDTPSFAADSAEKLGVSERTIQRQVKLAEDLDDEACELIRDHDVADNAAELGRLAKLEPEDQRAAAELLVEGKARTVTAARRQVEQAKPPAEAPEPPPSIDLRLCSVADLIRAPFPDRNAGAEGDPYQADLVHADPPWPYTNQRLNGTVDGHYEDMTLAKIVDDVADAYALAAADSYLVLWITGPMLAEWFLAAESLETRSRWRTFSWRYLSMGAWAKSGGIGIGHHWRGDVELVLLYAKGSPKPLRTTSNLFHAPRAAHSEKPLEPLRSMVNTFCPPRGNVLDLYAGWAPLARACLSMGRSYLGAEVDPHRHAAALQALAHDRDEAQPELFGGMG